MIKEFLVKLGIGSGSVDLKVPKTTVEQGETMDVEVTAQGGWVDQEINSVKYAVRTQYVVETDEGESYHTYTLTDGTIEDGFTLSSGEDRVMEGEITIPGDTPLTEGGREDVWVDTALDVDWANDPDDRDELSVQPGELLAATFEALESLGFHLHSAENDKVGSTILQEFEFMARSGPYTGDLDELEVVPRYQDGRIDYSVEVDQSGGMLSEMVGTDETQTSVSVSEADPDAIAEQFRETIEENI
jgi:sporulation-control protein